MRLRCPMGLLAVVATGSVISGCAGGMEATRFANPSFDFSFVQRVAVIPFDNLSGDRAAGLRATRLAITELLASGALDVVEPGEVEAALSQITGVAPGHRVSPSTEQIVSLGQALNVQAIILGTVTQSENLRSGSVPIPVVTLDVRMVEAETGVTVWAATQSERGATFSARVLGTGGDPLSETTRECVRNVLATLIQ